MPFFLARMFVLLLLTYYPPLTMWLPSLVK